MPSLLHRRNNTWLDFAVATPTQPLTVTFQQPGSSGQTNELPFVFSLTTSDNSRVTKMELYYLVGDVPTKIGETSELIAPFNYVIPLPASWTPGTHTYFGRAHTADGTYDSPQRVMTTVHGTNTNLRWGQPTASGQTVADDSTLTFTTNNPSAITQVRLYYLVGQNETLLGTTTTYGPFGYVFPAPAVGGYYLFARANLTNGTTLESEIFVVQVAPDAPTPTAPTSLKQAIYLGCEYEFRDDIARRLGRWPRGYMRFAVRDTWGNVKNDLNNEVSSVISRSGSDRHLLWVTVRLIQGPQSGPIDPPLSQVAAGARDADWDDVGAIFNRLSADQLSLIGIRLGHEFNGGWYYHGFLDSRNGTPDNAARAYAACFRRVVDRIRGQLNSTAKRAALKFDWNASGGMLRTPEQYRLCDLAYPGNGHVDIISCDVYNQDVFRTAAPNWHAVNGAGGPLAYVTARAISHGKRSAMSEGSPFMYKWKSGNQVGVDDGASTVDFCNRLLDWGQAEAQAGRLAHITLYERDVASEGAFTAFLGGWRDTSARPAGEHRRLGNSSGLAVLHPKENNANPPPTRIPLGIPEGVSGVPNASGRRGNAYNGIGGTRGTNNVQTNAPQAMNAFLNRVGGP